MAKSYTTILTRIGLDLSVISYWVKLISRHYFAVK